MIRTATRLWLIWHWLLCTDVRTGLECAHFPLVVRLTNALGEEVYRAERAEAELTRLREDVRIYLDTGQITPTFGQFFVDTQENNDA